MTGLERYGRRGERQDEVDLLDLAGVEPLCGVQCKHHEAWKTLPPAELQGEVDKALCFPKPLGRFILLTTAKKSAATQLRVPEIQRST